MWMSKKITSENKKTPDASIGEITEINGSTVSVQSNCEYRNIPTIAPYGIAYSPVQGAQSVVIPINNTACCLGVVTTNENLQPGEIMLYSLGGASLVLKNDGTVLVNGKAVLTAE